VAVLARTPRVLGAAHACVRGKAQAMMRYLQRRVLGALAVAAAFGLLALGQEWVRARVG
jgi:hypothetical protein